VQNGRKDIQNSLADRDESRIEHISTREFEALIKGRGRLLVRFEGKFGAADVEYGALVLVHSAVVRCGENRAHYRCLLLCCVPFVHFKAFLLDFVSADEHLDIELI